MFYVVVGLRCLYDVRKNENEYPKDDKYNNITNNNNVRDTNCTFLAFDAVDALLTDETGTIYEYNEKTVK